MPKVKNILLVESFDIFRLGLSAAHRENRTSISFCMCDLLGNLEKHPEFDTLLLKRSPCKVWNIDPFVQDIKIRISFNFKTRA